VPTALLCIVCWRRLLEIGAYATIDEMAAAEKINPSYVCRVLRLTLLAPEIVEVSLDGWRPAEMTLAALMRPFAVELGEQSSGNRHRGGWQRPATHRVGKLLRDHDDGRVQVPRHVVGHDRSIDHAQRLHAMHAPVAVGDR